MPLIIDSRLPCIPKLVDYGIQIINADNCLHSFYKNISIAIVNLMPSKQDTEIQLLRILGNLPFNIRVEFVYPKSHKPKNIYPSYISTCYKTIEELKDKSLYGMIVTGAPLEHLAFEQVDFWPELKEIMDYSNENVKSTLYICWAALAALYHNYAVNNVHLNKKIFGVLSHNAVNKTHPLFRGFDDIFYVPHSRYSEIKKDDLVKIKHLETLSFAEDSSIAIAASKRGHQFFITGHLEYDDMTLKNEYNRDKNKGINIDKPINYFKNDEISAEPIVRWRAHSNLFFYNWINEFLI